MAITRIRENQISTATEAILTSLNFNAADSVLRLPSGTTADQPGSPAFGTIRFNTEIDSAEIFKADFDGDGNPGWGAVGGGGGLSLGDDSIIRANTDVIAESIEIPAYATDPLYANSFTKGPVTISTGNTISVGTGARYTVW